MRGTPPGEGERDETPPRAIYLDAFAVDIHEVTVRQYRRCVDAGACSANKLTGDELPGKGFGPNTDCNWSRPARAYHPINCVSWQQASAYCTWVRKRLPTEAEWEKTARGAEGRVFPWGPERPNCKRAVMIWRGKGGCGKEHTWPVGSVSPAGNSPYGAQDLAGNVYEWVSDWYGARYYANSPERNPRGPSAGRRRIVRGGSWYNYGNYLRAAYRTALGGKQTRLAHVGFRCVRPLVTPASAPTSAPTSAPSSAPSSSAR